MSVSYTLRLPDNLKVLLDIEAAKHQQSLASYIVGACWAQLERHGGDGTVVVDGQNRADDLFVHADPGSAADVAAAQEASRITRYLPPINEVELAKWHAERFGAAEEIDRMASRIVPVFPQANPGDEGYGLTNFVADERVAPGELRLGSHDGPVLIENIGCPHEEWAPDGEQYRCKLAAGHKGKCVPGEKVTA